MTASIFKKNLVLMTASIFKKSILVDIDKQFIVF